MKLVEELSEMITPPRLILTHQTPDRIEGMLNPGGFTDGDRAVCLAMMLGLKQEACELIGFSTNSIGQ